MTRIASGLVGLVGGVVFALAAQAQVVNGDFETGVLAPWVVDNTASGRSIFTSVEMFDIDGPGPLGSSLCARFMAGQAVPNTGLQGVVIHQPVDLKAGAPYDLRVDWGVHALISTPANSGFFELVVDGATVAQVIAPVLTAGQRAYGFVAGQFTPALGGSHEVGVRITRTITAGAEVWQHIDNFSIEPGCRGDFNHDGGATVQDVFDFVRAYFTHDPRADFNNSGAVTPQDVFDFLTAWFAGCPA